MNQTTNDCFTHLIRLTTLMAGRSTFNKSLSRNTLRLLTTKFTLQDGGHTLVIDGNCTAIYRAEVPN